MISPGKAYLVQGGYRMDLSGLWGRRHRQDRPPEEQELHEQVDAAHREWVAAQARFQSVSEPELVDHAVHSIIAAEQKYMYLLRKLRESQGQLTARGE
jgi:hypothetical protein